jgi:hypothetical protein
MNLLTFQTVSTNESEAFLPSLLINLLAGFIFLVIYEIIFKNIITYFKNKKFIGHYIHCDLNFQEISTNNKIHYSDISIKFFKPNVIEINSFDYTNNNEREWIGRIKIDPDTGLHGFGTYKYQNDNFMGIHDILIIDEDTISFQLSYYKQSGSPYLMVKENSGKVKKQNGF